jgi:bifunctional non-homologous end joining protein LigD
VKARLEAAGLAAFLKNTGGKGLHVVTPLKPTAEWEEAKSFAKRLAEEMETDDPVRYISTSSKRAREGRIFVDYLRNGRGATAVAAYSTRARPGAAVSAPLDWDELSPRIRADHYTVNNIPKRLSKLGGDPWASFRRSARALPGAVREERTKRRARAR